MERESEIFKAGDRVKVIHIRKFLGHVIGDVALVKKGNYGGADPVIDVKWQTAQPYDTTVYANQFTLAEGNPLIYPVEDTRDYLNVITGETNAKLPR